MESYKDVILSQAPAMYNKGGSSTNITLENYKGILLCARPKDLPHGLSAQLRSEPCALPLLDAGGQPVPAFVPGGAVEAQPGLGPSVEERATALRNRNKRLENYKLRRAEAWNVLTRHKCWLRSFAAQVRKMKDDEIQREIELAHRAEKIRQREMQKHSASAAGQQQAAAAASLPPLQQEEQSRQQQQEEEQQQEHRGGDVKKATVVASAGGEKSFKSSKAKKKPKWALTEDEALDDELAGADDLVAFAQNLDYDKFISDYEVSGALAIMRERVEEIAKANHWSAEDIMRAGNTDQDDDDDNEDYDDTSSTAESVTRREQRASKNYVIRTAAAAANAASGNGPANAAHAKGWDSSTSVGLVLKRAIMRDALRLAERILASSASMQKIHTKFSLARVLQRCVLSGGSVTEAMQKPTVSVGKAEIDPRVVKIHPDATGFEASGPDGAGSQRVLLELQRSKERTQGLPYLYRCPAI